MSNDNEITLGVLSVIHAQCSPTQRAIACELGIALGLANRYLKRCAIKGYVKVSHAPANRYAYYLTPKGFAEKSRLTAEFLRQSFSLFRQARAQYRDLFTQCRERGWLRIGLLGPGDLCEIAVLCAHEGRITVVGIVDPAAVPCEVIGLPVRPAITDLGPIDAVLLTEMCDAHGVYRRALNELPHQRILVPELLALTPPVEEAP